MSWLAGALHGEAAVASPIMSAIPLFYDDCATDGFRNVWILSLLWAFRCRPKGGVLNHAHHRI
jgi:hypothetical protein